MFAPYDPVWTIGRDAVGSPGTGPDQTYSLWVWPVKITSTAADVSVTISAKAPPAAISCASVAPSGVPKPAPSWYWATITSASPFDGSPSVSRAATLLTASTGLPNSTVAMPPGVTSDGVSSVTAPMTPTWTPSTSTIAYSSSAGVVVPFSYTLAARYGKSASSATRPVRSESPWSNSWLPTPEAFRSSASSTSIVGLSRADDDANSEAPMLSPFERNRVLLSPASERSFSIVPANFTVSPSMRPWKSLMLSRLRGLVVGAVAVPSSNATMTGSWSLERYGVASWKVSPWELYREYSNAMVSPELMFQTSAPVLRARNESFSSTWSSEPDSPEKL